MRNTSGGPAPCCLWPQVLLAMAVVFVSYNVGSVSADPYLYSSPPPPSPSPSPPVVYQIPHHYPRIIKAVGKVYCYRCYDWINPKRSHAKKHLT
ncbi:hypothetical protein MKX03_033612, partial [Papaver bracteatum]